MTPNFSLSEFLRSDTAMRLRIDNTPSEEALANLQRLAETILQPVRDRYGKPITVTSGYRSEPLNKAVGGVATSQHLKGEAADIVCDNKAALYRLMKQMMLDGEITVGQLLDENNGSWIHVSLPNAKWRNYAKSIWAK